MKLETRVRKIRDGLYQKSVILTAESETESHAIDLMLGDCGAKHVSVEGEVKLSDGYGEHYIELRSKI